MYQEPTRRLPNLSERCHVRKIARLLAQPLKQNLATGHAGFEPLREGQHDDLLFATCLGVWA